MQYVVVKTGCEGIEELCWLTDSPAVATAKKRSLADADAREHMERDLRMANEYDEEAERTDDEILADLRKQDWKFKGREPGPEDVAAERAQSREQAVTYRATADEYKKFLGDASRYGRSSSLGTIYDYYCIMAWDGKEFTCVCKELGTPPSKPMWRLR